MQFMLVAQVSTRVKKGYNDRFPYHSIKHNETKSSLIRIDSETLYENVKDEIAKILVFLIFQKEIYKMKQQDRLKLKNMRK